MFKNKKITFAMELAMLCAIIPNVNHEILANIPKTKPLLLFCPNRYSEPKVIVIANQSTP